MWMNLYTTNYKNYIYVPYLERYQRSQSREFPYVSFPASGWHIRPKLDHVRHSISWYYVKLAYRLDLYRNIITYLRYDSSHPATIIVGSYSLRIDITSLDFLEIFAKSTGISISSGHNFFATKPF